MWLLFLLNLFIYFNWNGITLYYCGVFSPYIDMNQPLVPMCSPYPEPHSHLPPHPIPLGCPRALSLSALLHASNLYWSSILHMVIYMLQCHSLKSTNPRLLSQSPKIFSLHLCFFCCLVYRILITIFLNYMYMC